jgi:hypothetical protein
MDLYYVVVTANRGMPPLSTLVETTVLKPIWCNKCLTSLLGLVFVSQLSSWITRGASVPKIISMPEVHWAQTVHLSCTQNNFRAYGTFGTNRAQCKQCTYLASRLVLSPNGPKLLPLDQCHLEVPLGVPKKISMLVENSAQIVHLG